MFWHTIAFYPALVTSPQHSTDLICVPVGLFFVVINATTKNTQQLLFITILSSETTQRELQTSHCSAMKTFSAGRNVEFQPRTHLLYQIDAWCCFPCLLFFQWCLTCLFPLTLVDVLFACCFPLIRRLYFYWHSTCLFFIDDFCCLLCMLFSIDAPLFFSLMLDVSSIHAVFHHASVSLWAGPTYKPAHGTLDDEAGPQEGKGPAAPQAPVARETEDEAETPPPPLLGYGTQTTARARAGSGGESSSLELFRTNTERVVLAAGTGVLETEPSLYKESTVSPRRRVSNSFWRRWRSCSKRSRSPQARHRQEMP